VIAPEAGISLEQVADQFAPDLTEDPSRAMTFSLRAGPLIRPLGTVWHVAAEVVCSWTRSFCAVQTLDGLSHFRRGGTAAPPEAQAAEGKGAFAPA
jgi:hypothetical protein